MCGKTKVLLCDLKFHHERCPGHCTEQWMKRFPRLKVDRTIFHLDENIFSERPIKRFEFCVCLLGAIIRNVIIINERPPHDNTFKRLYCICEHVCAISM